MTVFFWILGSTLIVSAVSVIGVLALFLKDKSLNKILLCLVGLSTGAMMGGAFLHLLPEGVELFGEEAANTPYLLVLFGFSVYFLVEKILHWRHCHKKNCETHTFGYMNLVGDGVHNFIDGLIIAATFLAGGSLGFVALLAIILHEAPQEMGDYGVLLFAGFKKVKALLLNFLSASTVIFGGIIGYAFGAGDDFVRYLLPFAAGGFIYIGASDLLPELKKETKMKKFLPSFMMFLVGLALMFFLKE